MKQIYQHLHFVKEVYVSFTFLPTAIKLQDEAVVSKGWKVTVDESYREVSKLFLKTVQTTGMKV